MAAESSWRNLSEMELSFKRSRRRARALDGSRARVVGSQGEVDAAEAAQHLPQVAGAGKNVVGGIVPVEPELPGGAGHQLQQPPRAHS